MARKFGRLSASSLKKIGVVMKRAQYFITCNELPMYTINETTPEMLRNILLQKGKKRKQDNQLILPFTD